MNNILTWKTEIECGGFAGLKPFLANLAETNNCRVKILEDKSTFWRDKFTVEFKGTKESLTNLNNEFTLSMTMFNLPTDIKNSNYNVTDIQEKESNYSREMILEVKSSKRSKVQELAEAVADELFIAHEISEENNGFLKGKTVKVNVLGDSDKLEKFKAIFINVIESSKNRNKKKLKM